jgi:copper oxidase (laccase) domain-containing protein
VPRDRPWRGWLDRRRRVRVGAEVRAAFLEHDAGADAHFARGVPGKWHADLHALARQRLAACGVATVAATRERTGDRARFYSWRRDRAAGRMAALVWIAPDTAQ